VVPDIVGLSLDGRTQSVSVLGATSQAYEVLGRESSGAARSPRQGTCLRGSLATYFGRSASGRLTLAFRSNRNHRNRVSFGSISERLQADVGANS